MIWVGQMKNKESIEGSILLVLSIFFIRESLKLHTGQSWALSPALFPLIITSMALLFSISLILKSIGKSSAYREQGNVKLMLLIVALSFLYLIFLEKLHFIPSTILYLCGFTFILGERRWWIIGVISIITPLSIQYIFGNLLGVLLP